MSLFDIASIDSVKRLFLSAQVGASSISTPKPSPTKTPSHSPSPLINSPQQISSAVNFTFIIIVCAICVVTTLLLSSALTLFVGRLVKSKERSVYIKKYIRPPLSILFGVTSFYIAFRFASGLQDFHGSWDNVIYKVFVDLLILSFAWLAISFVTFWEKDALKKISEDSGDMQKKRYVRTQITIAKRLFVVLIDIIAVIAALLVTFDFIRQYGVGLFASAGVLSVVIGLAAQASLGNLFSGVQIALTGALRIGDIVKIDIDWGEIEEITLTFVVIRLWDDRRTIVPSSYFTQQPFENWSMNDEELTGTVNLDLNWNVPIDELRKVLQSVLVTEECWDGRKGSLQVASAMSGIIRVQAVLSASSISELRTLQASVRERLVEWVQSNAQKSFLEQRYLPPTDSSVIDAGAN
jgi:small-conductance mechanosensitive channel